MYHFISARPTKSPDPNAVASPERVARTRTRVAGVSQSQRTFGNFLRRERKETRNGELLTKIVFPQQLVVDRVPRRLD